jgi:hypothetical protein
MSRSSQTKVFPNLIWYESLLRSVLNYDQSHIWLCNILILKSGSEQGDFYKSVEINCHVQ